MHRRGRARLFLVVAYVGCLVLLVACTNLGPPRPGPTPGAVAGRVLAGPTCPVERPDEPCPPRPVISDVAARRADGSVVDNVRTGRDGSYRLSLAPGAYEVVVIVGGPFPACPAIQVTVVAGETADGDILCDTGIR